MEATSFGQRAGERNLLAVLTLAPFFGQGAAFLQGAGGSRCEPCGADFFVRVAFPEFPGLQVLGRHKF